MKRLLLATLLAAASATSANAAVINLAAVDTTTGLAPAVTTLTLGTGTYTATVAGIAGGGLYDASNLATTNSQFYPSGTPSPAAGYYREQYDITIGGVTTTVNTPQSGTKGYASAAAALAAATPFTFSVSAPNTLVSFAIPDLPGNYADNTGGVSLSVAAVPEAATWAMMVIGFGAVGGVMRGRRRATGVAVA